MSMRFTLSWLKDYLDTSETLEVISDTLTALGLEVETITDQTIVLAPFKVAQILEANPHPDADKLQVCRVNTGSEELQIVCGAPNARAGINVVLANVGTVIPTNNMKIKASKIRGVDSQGMLCSAAELGLGEDHSGIIEMPESNDNLAQEYAKIAGLDDPVIEIAITPNRGDCLGVYGIARDLAAAGVGTLKPLDVPKIKMSGNSRMSVAIDASDGCMQFMGCLITGVTNEESPVWLKNRLESIGINPISSLVDITNYIAYSFGRPLHVYDADILQGDVIVRYANQGETIEALDHKEYTLTDSMLVVADDNGPQAIAGIIGGQKTGCTQSTTNVFLEVAVFDPIAVSRTGRALDVLTDSRYRFERGVDPAFIVDATNITLGLITDICGGQVSESVFSGHGYQLSDAKIIAFKAEDVTRVTGVEVSAKDIKTILGSLGFKVTAKEVTAPSWRPDIHGTEDVVEEVIRVVGYQNIDIIPLKADQASNAGKVDDGSHMRFWTARRSLASLGLDEVMSWSFMSSGLAIKYGQCHEPLRLLNPISSDLDYMRPTIIPNMAAMIQRNVARGYTDLGFFEIGPIFEMKDKPSQRRCIAGVRSGNIIPKNVHESERRVDVFDAKEDIIRLLEALGVATGNLRTDSEGAPDYYHPGRSAALLLGKECLGYFGELHPSVLDAQGIDMKVVGFECMIGSLPPVKQKKRTARQQLIVSDFQVSSRDFAFVIDQSVPAENIVKAASKADKKLIESVSLFDVYQGEHIDAGKKSVAISLRIRAADHTLNEQELDQVSQAVIGAVEKLGGTLRG